MTHCFDIDIAKSAGVNSAIIFEYIRHWVLKNKANECHFHDDKYWTYCTLDAFCELFPYLTKNQIRLAIEKLINCGLIEKGNYSFGNINRTSWYTVLCDFQNNCSVENHTTDVGKTTQPITIIDNNYYSNANDLRWDNACACAREGENQDSIQQVENQQLVKAEEKENQEELGARVRAKFRSDVYGSTIKRDQLMKANSLYSTNEYYTIAESILSEWDASDMPPNEVTWRHFTNVFRIKCNEIKRYANQPKTREQQLAELRQGAERIVSRIIAESESREKSM